MPKKRKWRGNWEGKECGEERKAWYSGGEKEEVSKVVQRRVAVNPLFQEDKMESIHQEEEAFPIKETPIFQSK